MSDILRRLFTETWPAKAAQSAIHALMLPGQVAGGELAVQPTQPGMWSDVDEARQQATQGTMMDRAADLAGLVMGGSYAAAPAMKNASGMGIRAYHGSPHDFDRFDLSKIGTGEGAQAYGHGLYFAEREGVAKSYRDMLSQIQDKRPREQQLAADAIERFGDRSKAISTLEDVIKRREAGENAPWGVYFPYHDEAVLARDLLKSNWQPQPLGRMYEVNINAHPDQFLDWDKPLREQPEIYAKLKELPQFQRQQALVDNERLVGIAKQNGIPPLVAIKVQSELAAGVPLQEAIGKVRGLSQNPDWAVQTDKLASLVTDKNVTTRGILPDDWAGSSIARNVPGMEPSHIADTLRNQGIPGIKYLDQGSRSAGEGSRNYVVFDDKLIDILRKYGIAGASPLAALMMGGNEAQAAP